MSHKSRIICIIVLMLCCIGIIGYEPLKTYLVTSYNYKPSNNKVPNTKLYKPVSYNMNKAKPVTLHQVINARLHSNKLQVMGQLIDPQAHLHLPIGKGVGGNTLMLAAGTMRPDDIMGKGNFALAGHHMINKYALFTPLYLHAHKGQLIYIANKHQVYVYRLYLRKLINEHDIGIINNTRGVPIITLVTCSSSHLTTKRLELRGRLINKYPIQNTSQRVKKLFTDKTNNYKVLKGY